MNKPAKTPKRAKPRINTAVRFDPDLYERLRAAADDRELPMNRLVNEAVRDFLDRLIPADEFKLTR